MDKKLVIVFDDVAGQEAKVTFTNIGDATQEQAQTLVGDLAGHLNAGVKAYSLIEKYERESEDDDTAFPEPSDENEFNTVDQKCVYTFRRSVGEGDDKDTVSSTLEFPAPLASEFEIVPKQGKRLMKEHGDAIASSIETFLGDASNARFVEGWFKSKK